jgi:hypothetical protein
MKPCYWIVLNFQGKIEVVAEPTLYRVQQRIKMEGGQVIKILRGKPVEFAVKPSVEVVLNP